MSGGSTSLILVRRPTMRLIACLGRSLWCGLKLFNFNISAVIDNLHIRNMCLFSSLYISFVIWYHSFSQWGSHCDEFWSVFGVQHFSNITCPILKRKVHITQTECHGSNESMLEFWFDVRFHLPFFQCLTKDCNAETLDTRTMVFINPQLLVLWAKPRASLDLFLEWVSWRAVILWSNACFTLERVKIVCYVHVPRLFPFLRFWTLAHLQSSPATWCGKSPSSSKMVSYPTWHSLWQHCSTLQSQKCSIFVATLVAAMYLPAMSWLTDAVSWPTVFYLYYQPILSLQLDVYCFGVDCFINASIRLLAQRESGSAWLMHGLCFNNLLVCTLFFHSLLYFIHSILFFLYCLLGNFFHWSFDKWSTSIISNLKACAHCEACHASQKKTIQTSEQQGLQCHQNREVFRNAIWMAHESPKCGSGHATLTSCIRMLQVAACNALHMTSSSTLTRTRFIRIGSFPTPCARKTSVLFLLLESLKWVPNALVLLYRL